MHVLGHSVAFVLTLMYRVLKSVWKVTAALATELISLEENLLSFCFLVYSWDKVCVPNGASKIG